MAGRGGRASGGWLLRHTPSLTPAALELRAPGRGDRGDPALVEDFYARRAGRARAGLSRRGAHRPRRRARAPGLVRGGRPTSSSPTAPTVLAGTAPGEVALAARPDAGWIARGRPARGARRRRARARRPRAHRARDGVRPSHRRPRRRARGVRARLGGLSASPPPRARAGAASRRHVVHALTTWAARAARGALSPGRAPTRRRTPSTRAPASRAHTAITTGLAPGRRAPSRARAACAAPGRPRPGR